MGYVVRQALKAAANTKDVKPPLEARQDRIRETAKKEKRVVATREVKPVDLSSNDKPPELNTALMLDIAHGALTYWARWPEPYLVDIAAMWAVSTWMVDAEKRLLFNAHPRLFPIAPKGSGKTRVMKLTRQLSREPTGIVKAPVTAPGLRDAIDAGYTVFLDEVDRQVGRGMGHLDVQSIISAYEKDTGSLNGIGGYNPQSIYGPMMLAAKPRILTGTGGYIEDLFERSFIISMESSQDPNDPIPDLDEKYEKIMDTVPDLFTMGGEAVRYELADKGKTALWPIHTVPKALTSRQRELALPLLAVADRAVDPAVIDSEGKDLRWALRAREAVQAALLDRGTDGAAILSSVKSDMAKLGIKL